MTDSPDPLAEAITRLIGHRVQVDLQEWADGKKAGGDDLDR